MYTRLYMERLWKDQMHRGIFGMKVCIMTYDKFSRIMIKKGALAEYSQVELLLVAIPRDVRAKAVMELELDPRDPLTFTYDQLPNMTLTNMRQPMPSPSWMPHNHVWCLGSLVTQSQFEFQSHTCL